MTEASEYRSTRRAEEADMANTAGGRSTLVLRLRKPVFQGAAWQLNRPAASPKKGESSSGPADWCCRRGPLQAVTTKLAGQRLG